MPVILIEGKKVERGTSVLDPITHHPLQIIVEHDRVGLRRKHEHRIKWKSLAKLWEEELEQDLEKYATRMKNIRELSKADHIIALLMEKGRMHFSQIRKALRVEKGLNLSKLELGAELVHLSRTNQIVSEPHGFYK